MCSGTASSRVPHSAHIHTQIEHEHSQHNILTSFRERVTIRACTTSYAMGAFCVQTHLGLFAYSCSQIRKLWFNDIHVETTRCSKQTKNKKEDTKTHYIVHVYSTLHVYTCMYV